LIRCTMCRFVKDSAYVDHQAIGHDPVALENALKGPPALVGSGVSGLVFEQCYFHVTEPNRGCVEIGKPITAKADPPNFSNVNNLSFLFCHFESKHSAHGIQFNGKGQIQYLTVEGCFFQQRREEHGFYCIHAPAATLTAARIDGNKNTKGAGLKIGVLTTSTVVWEGSNTFLSKDTVKDSSTATLLGGLHINVGDDVLIGNHYQANGMPTGSPPELVTVTKITGPEITVTPALQTAHVNRPSSSYVRFGRIELGRAANNRIESFAPARITDEDTGNVFVVRGEFL
jgi:hypothetical protein